MDGPSLISINEKSRYSTVVYDMSSEINSQECKICELEEQLQNVTNELNLHRNKVNKWINQCNDFITRNVKPVIHKRKDKVYIKYIIVSEFELYERVKIIQLKHRIFYKLLKVERIDLCRYEITYRDGLKKYRISVGDEIDE